MNANAGRQFNEENPFSEYFDDCLKKKICENLKTIRLPSEAESFLQNYKLK